MQVKRCSDSDRRRWLIFQYGAPRIHNLLYVTLRSLADRKSELAIPRFTARRFDPCGGVLQQEGLRSPWSARLHAAASALSSAQSARLPVCRGAAWITVSSSRQQCSGRHPLTDWHHGPQQAAGTRPRPRQKATVNPQIHHRGDLIESDADENYVYKELLSTTNFAKSSKINIDICRYLF